MNNNLTEKDKLISNLNVVRKYLITIMDEYNKRLKVISKYQQHIQPQLAPMHHHMIASNFYLLIGILTIFLSRKLIIFYQMFEAYYSNRLYDLPHIFIELLSGNLFPIIAIILTVYSFYKENQITLIIVKVYFFFSLLIAVFDTLRYTAVYLHLSEFDPVRIILIVLSLITAVFISRLTINYIKKLREKNLSEINQSIINKTNYVNKQIDIDNKKVREQENLILKRIYKQQSEMMEISSGWFPPDYYILNAVDNFINSLINQRADTLKEAINIFEETKYRNQVLESQRRLENDLSNLRNDIASQDAVLQSISREQENLNILNLTNEEMIRKTRQTVGDIADYIDPHNQRIRR